MSATSRIGVAPLPAGDRTLMAPLAALMYAVAGLLVITSVLLLPHPAAMNRAGMLTLGALGIASAAVIWLWRERWPLWFFQITTADGSVILGFCAFAGVIYAIVLAAHPQPDADVAAHWLLTMVVVAVAAGIVTLLVTSRRRLEAEP